MNAFFHMGGYAAFVWPSFAVTTVVMVAIWGISRQGLKKAEAEFQALEAANAATRERDV